VYSSVSSPISSAIFNELVKKKIINLAIPVEIKAEILLDPSRVRHFVPEEYMTEVIEAMVDSMHKVFLFGLACAIIAGIFFQLIPWKPLLADKLKKREDQAVLEEEREESDNESDFRFSMLESKIPYYDSRLSSHWDLEDVNPSFEDLHVSLDRVKKSFDESYWSRDPQGALHRTFADKHRVYEDIPPPPPKAYHPV